MSTPEQTKSRRTGRILAIVAASVAVVLAVGFFIVQRLRAHQQESLDSQTAAGAAAVPIVDVAYVRNAPGAQTLVLPGETRAWYQTTIYARVNGYVSNWLVDIGDRVHKGQLLATVETPELDDQLVESQAKLKVSQSEVAVARANAEFSKSTYDRYWQSPQELTSEQERLEKKADYDSSLAKVEAAQAQVNLDSADVDRLTTLTQFKQVTAPFDGVITARRIDIGDLVTAGSTASTTSLYTVAQAGTIRVFVDVPQNAAMALKVGMNTRTSTPQFVGKVFPGKIARTAEAIDPIARTLRTEVDIANSDLQLLPGMYVRVDFEIPQSGLTQIPAAALLAHTNGLEAAVVDEQNKVQFRPIAIVRDDGDTLEIGTGLSVGDRVALNISNQISSGDLVQPNEIDRPPTQSVAARAEAQ